MTIVPLTVAGRPLHPMAAFSPSERALITSRATTLIAVDGLAAAVALDEACWRQRQIRELDFLIGAKPDAVWFGRQGTKK